MVIAASVEAVRQSTKCEPYSAMHDGRKMYIYHSLLARSASNRSINSRQTGSEAQFGPTTTKLSQVWRLWQPHISDFI
jgi:hypothetical protein